MTPRHRKFLLVACWWLAMGGQANSAVAPPGIKVDDALIGAVIEAIVSQLDGRAVEMKLDAVEQHADEFSGSGKLRIEGEEEWMGFRFRMPRDYRIVGPGDAKIDIGGVSSGERDLPNDPRLVSMLESEILTALSRLPATTSVHLHFDQIETLEAGASYRRIDTTGIAYFGRDNGRTIRIEGLYDQHKNAWLYTHYWLEKSDE